MADLDKVLNAVDKGLDASLERLFGFLRIPSISAQPAHKPDCLRAAAYARDLLAGMGFQAHISETSGLPGVVAEHPGPGGDAPHVLLYGHYDVQPPDPLDLWETEPFEPRLTDGPAGKRIVARGAVDDKGQVISTLEAVRAWIEATGAPPVRLSVLLEGEEECGSPSIPELFAREKARLAADFVLIADTNMWNRETPEIVVSLRGMVAMDVTLKAASRDLHSGLFGGIAANPIHVLTKILGALRDEAGRIAIPGFYDGIAEPTAAEIAAWETLGFDPKAFLGEVGLALPAGEAAHPPIAQIWARPTAEINGIFGGYQGDGVKTVIPASAGAKLSFRLVPGQDPQKVVEGLKAFVTARLPADVRAEFALFGAAPGIAVPADAPFLAAAQQALHAEFGRAPVLAGCGASIPIVDSFKRILGLDSLMVGFGLDDDRIHSPNEKFDLACFHRGMRAQARMLGAFAGRR